MSVPSRVSLTDCAARLDTGGPVIPPDWLLHHGIRNLLRCDEAEVVSELACYMFAQHRSLRVLSMLVEATRGTPMPSAITLLGALKSAAMVRRPSRADGALWVARLANERRILETYPPLVPELAWSEVRLNWRLTLGDIVPLARAYAGTARRLLRLAGRLHDRYASFKVLRVLELVGYYARYLRIFQEGRYALAVMSSHSNPHGIAFNIAARACGKVVPEVM